MKIRQLIRDWKAFKRWREHQDYVYKFIAVELAHYDFDEILLAVHHCRYIHPDIKYKLAQVLYSRSGRGTITLDKVLRGR